MDMFDDALPAQWVSADGRLQFALTVPAEAELFYPQWRDAAVARQLGMAPLADLTAVRSLIGYYSGMAQTGEAARYTVRQNGTVVGICGYNGIDRDDSRTEIGYEILPAKQGRGLGTAVIAALVAQAWGPLALNRVSAGVLPDNTPSLAALAANGFLTEGTLRQFTRIGAKAYDLVICSKVHALDAQ